MVGHNRASGLPGVYRDFELKFCVASLSCRTDPTCERVKCPDVCADSVSSKGCAVRRGGRAQGCIANSPLARAGNVSGSSWDDIGHEYASELNIANSASGHAVADLVSGDDCWIRISRVVSSYWHSIDGLILLHCEKAGNWGRERKPARVIVVASGLKANVNRTRSSGHRGCLSFGVNTVAVVAAIDESLLNNSARIWVYIKVDVVISDGLLAAIKKVAGPRRSCRVDQGTFSGG